MTNLENGARSAPRKNGRVERKVDAVHRRLREMALQSSPSSRLPTIDELCTILDTSRATLNDALEQLEAGNVIVRQRGSGIYVSPKIRQKNVALVFGESVFRERLQSPVWDLLSSNLIIAAQDRAETRDETFDVHFLRRRPRTMLPVDDRLARVVEAGQVNAVVGVGVDGDTYQWLSERGIPVIAFAGCGYWHVLLDRAQGVTLGTQHLIDRGCRYLRLWIPHQAALPRSAESEEDLGDPAEELSRAFCAVLERHHLPCAPDQIWAGQFRPDPIRYEQQGWQAAERLAYSPEDPTDGIVIVNDLMALGALKAMQRMGFGDRIKIASQSNKDTSVLYAFDDVIARVEFDPAEIVKGLSEMLDFVLSTDHPEQRIVSVGPSSLVLPVRRAG